MLEERRAWGRRGSPATARRRTAWGNTNAAGAVKLQLRISARRGPAERRSKFAGRRARTSGGDGEWQRHGGDELCAQGSGECEEDEGGAAVAPIKKKGSGLETAGPRRFASRPTAVRTMGRHVSKGYTRKNRRPHGGTQRSRTASGIRRGALNERAGVEAK